MNAPKHHPTARGRLLAGLPVTERRIDLAGISTAVLEGGDGPPMVLLHSPASHALQWLNVVPALVASHRIIVPDLPGHGETVVSEGVVDGKRVLAWLGELIERTCPAPPILVGHALGGAIAARFAALHSGRIAGLVLVDSMGLAPFRPAPEFESALMGFLGRPDAASHDRLMEQCAFDLDHVRGIMGARWQWLVDYNVDRARAPGLGPHQQALLAEFGFPEIDADTLARIAAPTSLIWGRHDLANPVGIGESASARYGWPLHVLENAGADPAYEDPQGLAAALNAAHAARTVPAGTT